MKRITAVFNGDSTVLGSGRIFSICTIAGSNVYIIIIYTCIHSRSIFAVGAVVVVVVDVIGRKLFL